MQGVLDDSCGARGSAWTSGSERKTRIAAVLRSALAVVGTTALATAWGVAPATAVPAASCAPNYASVTPRSGPPGTQVTLTAASSPGCTGGFSTVFRVDFQPNSSAG